LLKNTIKKSNMKYSNHKLLLLALPLLFIACKPKTPQERVLGTWLVKDDRDTSRTEKVTFYKDTLVTEKIFHTGAPVKKEPAEYRVSADGKTLMVKPVAEKDSVVLNILLLNDTTIRMLLPFDNSHDTIVFIRTK
ncbi:MAG TPA: hypothetical protein VHB48_01000, partial [Chitinophagaceae bacterium]|nr:hypothetical protein [Chitinophagaceae bacterium]